MSRRELFFKRLLRLFYFICMIASYVAVFFVLDYDFWACFFLILSLIFLTLIILSFKNFVKPNFKLLSAIKKSIVNNSLKFDEIKEIYHFNGIENSDGRILKVFFDKSNTKRFIVYQESNCVKVCFEYLEYFDDDTKFWTYNFAQWTQEGTNSSIYADIETALNNNKELLKDFHEEKIKSSKQTFKVEINWKDITINSDIIPFGSYNCFDIQIKNKTIKNSIIHNTRWCSLSSSQANLYIDKQEALPINKKFKFTVIHNEKIIGVGRYYPTKESIDF